MELADREESAWKQEIQVQNPALKQNSTLDPKLLRL